MRGWQCFRQPALMRSTSRLSERACDGRCYSNPTQTRSSSLHILDRRGRAADLGSWQNGRGSQGGTSSVLYILLNWLLTLGAILSATSTTHGFSWTGIRKSNIQSVMTAKTIAGSSCSAGSLRWHRDTLKSTKSIEPPC